jgi:Cys-tRNA(Pro)/Cys-tRNA(Cys) deacylase
MKTNAVRLLDRAGITYDLRQYAIDEEDQIAEHAAAALGMPIETIFKTLIVAGDTTGHLFALIPAGMSLDPRLLAIASGNKRIEMAPQRELLALTGYLRGAVPGLY